MNLLYLTPLITIAVTSGLAMIWVAVRRNHLLTPIIAVTGLIVSALTTVRLAPDRPVHVTGLLTIDRMSAMFSLLVLFSGLSAILLGMNYFKKTRTTIDEYCILVLLAVLGCQTVMASSHFAAFLLGLEILSISLFVLVAYPVHRAECLEASIKYFILATVSTSCLIFGAALLYAGSGSLELPGMITLLRMHQPGNNPLLYSGLCLFLAGVGFKLALVPFHMWTPDVYEGAPAPVTVFIAGASKAAVAAFVIRAFQPVLRLPDNPVWYILAGVSILSMFAGNILALLQNRIQRILAFSSIAHLGYLLVAILAGSPSGQFAALYYLAAYVLTITGAFGILSLLADEKTEPLELSDINGLYWRRPWLAAGFTVMILSLAGIPLTAGFLGKFFVLESGIESARWILVVSLILNSTISIVYYLRLLIAAGSDTVGSHIVCKPAWTDRVVVIGATILLVWLGIFPYHLNLLIDVLAR